MVFSGRAHKRNKKTKRVEAFGRALEVPDVKLQQRVERICCAIDKKEEKFYKSTDILLVQEDSSIFEYSSDLHELVSESVSSGLGKSYKKIYIIYGQEVKCAK